MENNTKSETSPMLLLIQGCKRNDRESQRLLYQHYYSYALSICLRYCHSAEEAKEVVNDGFLKVFGKINQYRMDTSFKAWLRRIMINASIDLFRKEQRHYTMSSMNDHGVVQVTGNGVFDELSYLELIKMIQSLSPGYRAVFNLYVIDGYTHREIGEMLGISEGTSKSNLLKARERLKKELLKMDSKVYAKSV